VQWTIEIQEVLFGARSAAGFFIGFIVAALLTAGQAFTSEDNLPAYGAFLVIDCAFTWTQLRGPVDRVMASYKPDDAVALYVAYALLVGFSYLSASLPEQTVFGRRNVSSVASWLRGGRK
jgi:drug/metabolite transporter (DMT)-like permease